MYICIYICIYMYMYIYKKPMTGILMKLLEILEITQKVEHLYLDCFKNIWWQCFACAYNLK